MAKLLLHICCGPCATYVLEELNPQFEIKGFYYNPNIQPSLEYQKRKEALEKLAQKVNLPILWPEYQPEDYFRKVLGRAIKLSEMERKIKKGFVLPPEKRCPLCYELRLEKTAQKAQELGFDYFSTTLLISPYQDLGRIKKLGLELADRFQVEFYFQDFTSGFLRSKILSKEYDLYRQKYCGCLFSRFEAGVRN